MRPEEFLALVAPLGVGIAGFAGLVSAFYGEREGGPAAFVRLQSLVIASFAVTFLALWPAVVLFAVPDQADLWRVACAIHILYLGQIRIRRARALRRLRQPWTRLAPWYVDILFYPVMALDLLNIVFWGAFAPYAASVVFQLWVASAFFYGFVLEARQQGA